ncbi:MAG TPA: hypothetical protein VM755_14510 [Stellaceae bacterium]|nr:hypothetical protein [Stellaceae bacterium]
MLDVFRFRFRLWFANRRYRHARREYRPRFYAAQHRGDETEKNKVFDDLIAFDRRHDEEVAGLHSSYLLGQAEKLLIPTPEYRPGDTYEKCDTYGGSHLTIKARGDLRDAIRRERKERGEINRLWLTTLATIISALAGLVGALIGLVAIRGGPAK